MYPRRYPHRDMVLLFTRFSYDKNVEFFAKFSRNMSYYFVTHIDIIQEKYLWRGKMKNIKKILVVVACLSLLVNVGSYGNHTDEPIQTCGIVHWETGVK